MRLLTHHTHIAAACLISLLLSACGQKGDLYLVDPATEMPANTNSELVDTLPTDADAY